MSQNPPAAELEARFLALLDQSCPPARDWIAVLETARQAGIPAATGEWAGLAQEALAKAQDIEGGLELLKWRAENTPPETMTGKDWVAAAEVFAGTNPLRLALIQEAGFGQPLAARECVRRLRLLEHLQPGALCLHRTWGFGWVRKIDPLYRKIEIDFRGRPGHGLAMKVAAESLELLSPEHLLARLHRDPDGIRQQVQQVPAEIIRQALADFGPLTPAALQAKLTEFGVVAETDWPRFWDAGRKALKSDPAVEVPAKRSEPLRLRQTGANGEEAWFDRLAAERDLKTILQRVRELADRMEDPARLSPAQRQTLANRLTFVLSGATRRQTGWKLLAALLARRLHLDPAQCNWPAAAREFLAPELLTLALHDLPARDLPAALEFLWEQDPAATRGALLGQLKHISYAALEAAMDLLLREGAGEDCRRQFAEACATHLIRQEMLLWILRHPGLAEEWDLPPPSFLAPLIVEELEQEYSRDRLKTQKTLRDEFQKTAFLRAVFEGLTPGRQQDFFRRLNQSPAWPGLDRQVLQAQILKLLPKLQTVITGEESAAPATSGPVTSHRSYRERREQLEKIIQVDLPAIAKEIAVARSYGDLRENFEYKAAKDMQRLLLARRAELEDMLARVRPTDFSEAAANVAGIGTTIVLEYPDGRREQFHILGEWDQLPEKQIISSNTRLAKAVAGKAPGETVRIPAGDGTEDECLLRAVEPLPEEIREWVK